MAYLYCICINYKAIYSSHSKKEFMKTLRNFDEDFDPKHSEKFQNVLSGRKIVHYNYF